MEIIKIKIIGGLFNTSFKNIAKKYYVFQSSRSAAYYKYNLNNLVIWN